MNNNRRNKIIFKEYSKINPWASQTFSKSHYMLPGKDLTFAKRAKGSLIYDVDGNRYIDLINSLLPVILGYCDKDINKAISQQLEKGTIFSLPSELEFKVSKLILEFFDKDFSFIRFGKNGSDVTSASVRLARAHNNKENIIAIGYHGWHDWYIGSTKRNIGTLKYTSKNTFLLPYNDFEIIKKTFLKLKGNVTAIIMEPFNFILPKKDYLSQIRKFCDQNNIVLIFDEIITGFRYRMGGSYRLFNVTPDIVLLGKGIANGMPLSAIIGKKKYIKTIDKIFFSGTFGGECLSLIACFATLNKIKKKKILDTIWDNGNYLKDKLNQIIINNDLSKIFKLEGLAPWFRLTCYGQSNHIYIDIINNELLNHGILTQGSFNINYSLDKKLINKIVKCYSEVFMIFNNKNLLSQKLNQIKTNKEFKSVR